MDMEWLTVSDTDCHAAFHWHWFQGSILEYPASYSTIGDRTKLVINVTVSVGGKKRDLKKETNYTIHMGFHFCNSYLKNR